MKLFLDSANLEDINEAMDSGIISGITTNPSIMAKEGETVNVVDHYNEIFHIINPNTHISIGVLSSDPNKMFDEAWDLVKRELGPYHPAIEIPVAWKYLSVIRDLSDSDIAINATCIFTRDQAIAAINAGARYVSFFVNRALDLNINVYKEMRIIRKLIDEGGYDVEIICGSIRNMEDIGDCFYAGAHIVTASLPLLKQLCEHEGTDTAIAQFEAAAKKLREG